MAAKKKKKPMALFVLLGFIVVLAVAYFAINVVKTKEETQKKEEQDSLVLYKTVSLRISKMRVKNEYYDMTLVLDDEKQWVWEGQEEFLLNSGRVTAIVSQVTSLIANTKVADSYDNPAEYGFDQPTAYVEVESSDGNIGFTVGGRAPVGTAFYLAVDGDPALYTIDSQVYYTFHRTLAQMMKVETIDSIEKTALQAVSVSRQGEPEVEVLFDQENRVGTVTAPYEIPQMLDETKTDAFMDLFRSFSFKDCEGLAEDVDLAAYGLKEPRAVIEVTFTKDEQPMTYELQVGDTSEEDEEYIYVLWANSGRIYTMDVDDLLPKLEFVTSEYLDKTVFDPDTMEITKINGEETISAENMEAYTAAFATVQIERDLKEEKEAAQVLALTVVEGDMVKDLVFYEYDGQDFYQMEINGYRMFLVGKRELDEVLKIEMK